MENASATRLRYKGSATSSSKKRKHSDSHQHQHHDFHTPMYSSNRTSRQSRSRSRSPKRLSNDNEDSRRGSKHKSRARSRSRSRSPSSRSGSRSSKYKVTPAGYAPDSLSSYCFDDGEDLERAYLLKVAQDIRASEMEKLRAEEEAANDPWLSHLFDEMANDDPFEYHSNRFSAPTPSGSGRKHDKIQSLSDDAYASYMRKGMRRTTAQKEFMEWAEWAEEQERLKYRDARMEQKRKDEERSRRRQERRERERLDEGTAANARAGVESHQFVDDTPANRLRKRAHVDLARRDYEQGWRAILVDDSQGSATTTTTMPRLPLLSMVNIPWPPLYGTSESPNISDAPAAGSILSLFDFLFFGTTADQTDVRKQLLRREQLKFHPDKFKQRFGARLPAPPPAVDGILSSAAAAVGTATGERERILEQVDKVARALNEIGEMF
ncbi:hypothetical protein BGZ95_001907 [Linnemannia exigua]|uniref:Uncharacterized protein n=1 Tax=Linnemannia exigua TaxID=604196 RepID=A0AAD4H3E5_9FUNG|nr:hypothetical protein BGZ95_001907 [Linnemannia exigua]